VAKLMLSTTNLCILAGLLNRACCLNLGTCPQRVGHANSLRARITVENSMFDLFRKPHDLHSMTLLALKYQAACSPCIQPMGLKGS
jgi:hypothetical protein